MDSNPHYASSPTSRGEETYKSSQALAVIPKDDPLDESDSSDDGLGIFRSRRPAHVGQGLLNATGNICKGIGLGAAGLFAAPIAGAQTDGAKGFAKGLAAGTILAVAMPIAGAAMGVQQIASGLMNTPAAIKHSGVKVWDPKKKIWKFKYQPLDQWMDSVRKERAAAIAKNAAYVKRVEELQKSQAAAGGDRNVVDPQLYDLLEVSTNATPMEIRKAYFKKARDCHPDKNPSPEATEMFQKLSEANTILSNPETREKYDKYGMTEDMQSTDDDKSKQIFQASFTMLFGSDLMEPFVGQLALVSMMEYESIYKIQDLLPGLYSRPDNPIQEYREIFLAVQLRERLQPLVEALYDGDENGVLREKGRMAQMAADLCKASFGPEMLMAVAYTYSFYATQYKYKKSDKFSDKLRSQSHKLSKKSKEMKEKFNSLGLVVGAMRQANKLAQDIDDGASSASSSRATSNDNTSRTEYKRSKKATKKNQGPVELNRSLTENTIICDLKAKRVYRDDLPDMQKDLIVEVTYLDRAFNIIMAKEKLVDLDEEPYETASDYLTYLMSNRFHEYWFSEDEKMTARAAYVQYTGDLIVSPETRRYREIYSDMKDAPISDEFKNDMLKLLYASVVVQKARNIADPIPKRRSEKERIDAVYASDGMKIPTDANAMIANVTQLGLNLTIADVQCTVLQACRAYLNEPGVELEIARHRTSALKIAGNVFNELATRVMNEAPQTNEDFAEKLEKLMQEAVMKVYQEEEEGNDNN